VSQLKLKNNREPDYGVEFRVSVPYMFYLAKNLFVYDPESKKVIAEINEMKSVKDIDEINFGHETNSIAFMKDILQLEVKRRTKPKFDGNFFYIPLGYKVKYDCKNRRNARCFTRHDIKTCSFYIPTTALKSFKLVNKGEKVNNFTKEFFRRFRMEIQDSQTSEEFVLTGKCNNSVVDLNKNKDMVNELKTLTKDIHGWGSDLKVTQEWKQKLLVNLENFVNKYEDYEVQQ